MNHQTVTLDIARAVELVESSVGPAGEEHAAIINAFGRTLTRSVIAAHDVPLLNTAVQDGFALRHEDTVGASAKSPRPLSILSESRDHVHSISAGTLLPVRKGDHLPVGADAVVTARQAFRPINDPQVFVLTEAKLYSNVKPAGALVEKGTTLLPAGTVVTGAEMALLAGMAIHSVHVSRVVRVAIITTGASVVDDCDRPETGGYRNTARYALAGMVMAAGCELSRLIHVRSGRPGLEKALSHCTDYDAVLVALGPDEKHDMAISALRNTGQVSFERLHMEPGMLSAFGTLQETPVFILQAENVLEPFEVLARPALMKMQGRRQTQRSMVKAALQSTLKLNVGSVHYIRATTAYDDDHYVCRPLLTLPHDSPALIETNGLIVVPRDIPLVKRGEAVDVMLLRDCEA